MAGKLSHDVCGKTPSFPALHVNLVPQRCQLTIKGSLEGSGGAEVTLSYMGLVMFSGSCCLPRAETSMSSSDCSGTSPGFQPGGSQGGIGKGSASVGSESHPAQPLPNHPALLSVSSFLSYNMTIHCNLRELSHSLMSTTSSTCPSQCFNFFLPSSLPHLFLASCFMFVYIPTYSLLKTNHSFQIYC